MKRTLSILLALTMLLALMTACGGAAPASSGETAQVEEASSAPAEEAQEQAPAAEEASVPAELEEAASADEPEEPEIPAREPVEYPICDPDEIEFSIFTSAGGMGVSIETLDQFPAFVLAHEATGVKTTYSLAAPEATEVKINLNLRTFRLHCRRRCSGPGPVFGRVRTGLYESGRCEPGHAEADFH